MRDSLQGSEWRQRQDCAAEKPMAYYVKFEFFIPEVKQASPQKAEARTRLIERFRKAAARNYGGWTGWDPDTPGLVGEWRQGRKIVPDMLLSMWVLVDAGVFEEALEDFTRWKRLFERRLDQRMLLVTHQLVETIGSLDSKKASGGN